MGASIEELERRIEQLEAESPEDHVVIICWSGDMDKVLSALTLATGSAVMGSRTTIFFTFWGLLAAKRQESVRRARSSFLQKMFSWMLPTTPDRLRLSRYNLFGLGAFFFRRLLGQQGGAGVIELRQEAQDLGVKFMICTHSMKMMGVQKEELIPLPDDHYCGVAHFTASSKRARHIYFI